jgi:hypothetical protein
VTKFLAQIAANEVGVREVGGNNNGERVRDYQEATTLAPAAWPWCAAFVDWCLLEWLMTPEVADWLNLQVSTPEEWRPKTALAYGFLGWAKARPKTTVLLHDRDMARPGDIVVFDFSHVGIVESDSGHQLITIEGNTNGRGERDSESGDGVWRKTRPKALARNFIRIRPALALSGSTSVNRL